MLAMAPTRMLARRCRAALVRCLVLCAATCAPAGYRADGPARVSGRAPPLVAADSGVRAMNADFAMRGLQRHVVDGLMTQQECHRVSQAYERVDERRRRHTPIVLAAHSPHGIVLLRRTNCDTVLAWPLALAANY